MGVNTFIEEQESTCAFQEIAFVCVFETEQMIPGGGTKLSATQFRVIQVHQQLKSLYI